MTSGEATSGEHHNVSHPGFDGRVREYGRQGYRQWYCERRVDVEEFATSQHAALGDGPAVDVQHSHTRASMREQDAYGVMVALADYLGYEVTPK